MGKTMPGPLALVIPSRLAATMLGRRDSPGDQQAMHREANSFIFLTVWRHR